MNGRSRRRLVLLGAVLAAPLGCSLVDLCYLNPSTCAVIDGAAADASLPDAPPCDSGADPCACLPEVHEFSGCGTVEALLARSPYVYWMGYGDGNQRALCRAMGSDASGAVSPSYETNRWTDYYGGFAVDDQYVYLGFSSPADSLVRGAVGGDAMAPLISSLPSATFNLTAAADGLYWNDTAHDVCESALDGTMPLGDSGCGGAPLYSVPGDAGTPLSTATHNRDFLAVSAAGVYQTYYNAGTTVWLPRDGGAPVTLSSGGPKLDRPIAATTTDVVWSEPSGSGFAIQRVAATGGPVVKLASSPAAGFAIDATFVYYVDGAPNAYRVERAPLAGGSADVVACVPSTLGLPDVFAVTSDMLYFANGNNNGGTDRVEAVPTR